MKHLKEKLQGHFGNNNVNKSAFESNAELAQGTVYNILNNRSKDLNLDTLIKIANALNCSIDGLVGREEYFKSYILKQRSNVEYNAKLIYSIIDIINKFIGTNKINKPSLGDVLYSMEEIYEYSNNTNDKVLDEKFALWILKKQFKLD